MKTVFTGGPALRRVYTEKTLSRIAALSGSEPVFSDVITADAEALFTTWGMRSYTADHIKQNFPCLKYIFYGAGTVQSFARPFMENGVRIFSAWQANGVPVAEFTVSQIILCGKRYFDVFTGAKATPKGNYGLKVGVIGLGVIGRKRDIKYHASPETLAELAALQKNILRSAAGYLKEGGVLIYSTCTINEGENGEIAAFIEKELGFCPDPLEPYLPKELPGIKDGQLQMLPHVHGTDGFYIARFVKKTC